MPYQQIALVTGASRAVVAPARGGLITEFSVGNCPILFLNRATLDDPTSNVRGGIPILFPNAGRLHGDMFLPTSAAEPAYVLQQHGFARECTWQVIEQTADRLTLTWASDERSLVSYPYAHHLTQIISLTPSALSLTLSVTNNSDHPMPIAPGWHPYFRVESARKHDVAVDVLGFQAIPADGRHEVNYGLPFKGHARIMLPNARVTLTTSPEFRHLQIWTLPEEDFVCVEPWVGPLNSLNNPESRLMLSAGETMALTIALAVVPR